MIRIIIAMFISSSLFAETNDITTVQCANLPHTDGTTKSICDKDGKAFLLLEFFSSRCGHCRRNVPQFKKLETDVANVADSRLVSMNSYQEAVQFGREYSLVTDIAVDSRGQASRSFNIQSVPTILLLNAANEIVYRSVGVLNENSIAEVKRLVGAQ